MIFFGWLFNSSLFQTLNNFINRRLVIDHCGSIFFSMTARCALTIYRFKSILIFFLNYSFKYLFVKFFFFWGGVLCLCKCWILFVSLVLFSLYYFLIFLVSFILFAFLPLCFLLFILLDYSNFIFISNMIWQLYFFPDWTACVGLVWKGPDM